MNELEVNEEGEGFGSTCGNAKTKLFAICSLQTLTADCPSLLINPLKDDSNLFIHCSEIPETALLVEGPLGSMIYPSGNSSM